MPEELALADEATRAQHFYHCRWAADEIERLQAIVDKLPKTADNVQIEDGMFVWESPRHRGSERMSCAMIRIEIRPRDYRYLYSTREAAEEARKESEV
jgi:hypothetical protein